MNSVDFVGLNHYTSRFIADMAESPDHGDFYKSQKMARIGKSLSLSLLYFRTRILFKVSVIISWMGRWWAYRREGMALSVSHGHGTHHRIHIHTCTSYNCNKGICSWHLCILWSLFCWTIYMQAASEWLYIVPWGIRKVLNYIKQRYKNPIIIITENGMCIKSLLTL